MSQSEEHKFLVEKVAEMVDKRFPGIMLKVDLQHSPGDELPPLVEGFRPDVYGRNNQMGVTLIAEAKTDNDIDNKHTHRQVMSFISYLERQNKGYFILAVTGIGANRAKTLLRFACKELNVKNTTIEVFDCCDFWQLDLHGGVKWHLN